MNRHGVLIFEKQNKAMLKLILNIIEKYLSLKK